MTIKKLIVRQFGNPSGYLGQFIGFIMSIKNADRAKWTLKKLNPDPADLILEVGYGPGKAIMNVAKNLTTGFITGIDHSNVMFNQASKRNRKYIQTSKVKLQCGTVWDFQYPDNYFDKIFGSNVHFFWKNPVDEFTKLFSWLKPNGQLIMVFQPRWTKTEEEVKRVVEKTKNQFMEAGLRNIEIDFKRMKPVTCISISGQK